MKGDSQQLLNGIIQRLQQYAGFKDADMAKELVHVNRQIYERNVELAIRNQTLSLLRKIYEIINTSIGVKETAQKLISAIGTELKFQAGVIALIDKQENLLKSTAFFRRDFDEIDKNIATAHQYLANLSLSLQNRENFAVDCVMKRRTRLTNSLYDVIAPLVDEKKAEELQKTLGIATLVLYPIVFGNATFGVLIISLDKHVGDLSRAEREALHELIGVVGIAIDRVKLYSELKEANEKLKALDKLKDEFVSVASHELRTPMTAIKSYLWMALAGKGGAITEKQRYYLDRAYSSTDRLIKLVNDMLNISRIESGRMTYDMEKVDLSQLINDVIADVKPRADELGVSIVYDTRYTIHDTIPAVLADADKIKEVLFNLVGNSLKFTQKGGSITIILKKVQNNPISPRFGGSSTLVECSVLDTGVGISAEDMDKLFQKFGLIPGSYTINKTDQQGTGLGLFITKSIIEAHGGTISAYSPGVGKGAKFSFTVPVFDQQKWEQFHEAQEGKEKIGMIHTAVV